MHDSVIISFESTPDGHLMCRFSIAATRSG